MKKKTNKTSEEKSSDSSALIETDECIIPPVLPISEIAKRTLEQPQHEILDVTQYMELEAKGEKVLHLEKVKSEPLFGHKLDAWDVFTSKERYWVITAPLMNLYPQNLYQSLDYTISFHIGICTRLNERSRLQAEDREHSRMPEAWRIWTAAASANEVAEEPEDYQAIASRCRECLLSLARSLASAVEISSDHDLPKASDFVQWSEVIANEIAAGDSAKELRGYLKGSAKTAWQLVSNLVHRRNANNFDSELALEVTNHVLHIFQTTLMRHECKLPEKCSECGSRRIVHSFRPDMDPENPYLAICTSCGMHATRVSRSDDSTSGETLCQ